MRVEIRNLAASTVFAIYHEHPYPSLPHLLLLILSLFTKRGNNRY
jgi:hypothetical protein